MSDDVTIFEEHFPPREYGVVQLEEHMPHRTAEVVCLRCLYRYQAVWPEATPMKDLECSNCERVGYIIGTGA